MKYIVIPPINGRYMYRTLAIALHESNLGNDVYYYAGGFDDSKKFVKPHLRFDNDDDAVIFAIKYGYLIQSDIPVDNV